MTIHYNCTNRKPLVQAISEIIGAPAEYQFMPTCAYRIGDDFTVTKDGNLEINDRADSKEVEHLLEELDRRGYNAPQEPNKLTVQMPAEFFTEQMLTNLRKLIENKSTLFKSAFKTDSLEIEVNEKAVEFPWFTPEQYDDTNAYSNFIYMLCEFVKNQKRVNNKPDTTDNPKYAMRCFLLRIGMIGTEYKNARKVLLRNLTGSSAFRHGGENNDNETA
jgi:hypothetical protein